MVFASADKALPSPVTASTPTSPTFRREVDVPSVRDSIRSKRSKEMMRLSGIPIFTILIFSMQVIFLCAAFTGWIIFLRQSPSKLHLSWQADVGINALMALSLLVGLLFVIRNATVVLDARTLYFNPQAFSGMADSESSPDWQNEAPWNRPRPPAYTTDPDPVISPPPPAYPQAVRDPQPHGLTHSRRPSQESLSASRNDIESQNSLVPRHSLPYPETPNFRVEFS